MAASLYIPVVEQSQAGEARRLAVSWAIRQGCPAADTAQLALSVAELARNLVLHTQNGGFLLLRILKRDPFAFELMSLDRGPGMENLSICMRDGYSTSGTAGTGMGAVSRASTVFDAYTSTKAGTALLSHIYCKPDLEGRKCGFGAVNIPKTGEIVCGDSFSFQALEGGRARLMVADGLGHGPLAAEASALAVNVFEKGGSRDIKTVLEQMHLALSGTRGAAVAIAEVNAASEKVLYAGVGNISANVITAERSSHLVSMNGTVGSTMPKVRDFTYEWAPGSVLVMNSDGLKTNWRLDRFPGLLSKHPALIAGMLFRDFSRGTDDSTVAALRFPYEHRV